MIPLNQFKKYKWQRWIDRPFKAFVISIFKSAPTKKNFSKIGIKNVECETWLFQYGYWYESEIIWDRMAVLLERWLKKNSIFDISKNLKKFHKESLKKIDEINKQKDGDLLKQLDEIKEILSIGCTYIWLAHGLEIVYKKRLDKAIKKHKIADPAKYIGDISFPKKKNLNTMMTEAMLRGDKAEDICKKYAWLRVRDGFARPYSLSEIKFQMKDMFKPTKYKRPSVPRDMKDLVAETQELVFYRTERTDVFYHLFFKARPLLRRVAKHFGIEFEDLKYYSIQSLIQGKPKRYRDLFSVIGYKGDVKYYYKKIVEDKNSKSEEIEGSIAYQGIARGRVKIVKTENDLSKVKQGDILVTQMTFPSFLIAMKKAAAFVTDEGGITCHAAIVAREMKKPCVIGTKVATKVLKDGDMVEVDAENGIIKKI